MIHQVYRMPASTSMMYTAEVLNKRIKRSLTLPNGDGGPKPGNRCTQEPNRQGENQPAFSHE